MFCKNCGKSYDDAQMFCTGCGQPLTGADASADQGAGQTFTDSEPVQVNPVAGKFVSAFSDNLFMVICILITANAVLALLGGSLNVLSILYSIFMWLTYVDAKKGIANAKYMRFTSGCVFASTIVLWVACGLMALAAPISLAGAGFISQIVYEVAAELGYFLDILGSSIGILFFVIFALVAGVGVVLNIFFYIPAHKLAKSMYTSVNTGVLNLENTGKIKVWMLVLGIITGLSAISSIATISSFLSSGWMAAMYIILYIWFGKHFENKNTQYNAY